MSLWIDSATGKLVNINAPYKGRSKLDTPEIRAEVGVVEIQAEQPPPPPNGFSVDEAFYRSEDWNTTTGPYIVWTPKSVESVREMLKAKVKAMRDQKETDGFIYMTKPFDSDERSVARITSAALTAMAIGPTFTIDWTAADNSIVTLDQAAMLGMPAALAMNANALHSAAKAHKTAIDTADFETLTTYDITTGWPV